MDIEKLNQNYSNIDKYSIFLNKYSFKNSEEFEDDMEKYLSISMGLFNMLNSVIEIGEEIIDEYGFDYPQKYRDIFVTLQKKKVISKELSEKFQLYMKHRNMLAHQYDNLELNSIYDLFLDKKIFQKFREETQKYIEEKK